MIDVEWRSIFDEIKVEPAATLEQVTTLAHRLNHPLPSSYQNFLLWSNGGWARTGQTEFGFFDTQSVVEYLESYEFPEFMSGAVPFALNGGGVFYVFDFRSPLVDGECPVWACGSGANTWEDATFVADSFGQLCEGLSARE